jgi:hypothetical protein
LLCVGILLSIAWTTGMAGGTDKYARAVRASAPPRIDGSLRDPVWKNALPFSDFLQSEPHEGEQPTQRTEIRVLYDDEALYLGAMMFDTEPDGIVARLSRRDEEIRTDRISFRFDTFHDHQTAYEFTVTSAGARIDILQYNDGRAEDDSWDVVWEAETVIGPDGWSAEIRIPFAMLRFLEADEQEWGMQVIRSITRNQENLQWALKRKSESGWISRFGHLTGLEKIPARTSIEVLPYVVAEDASLAAADDHPAYSKMYGDAGLDLKYRPSANLTIDATFNPDFGQVEADPAVLNLSTFETFYPERRPFFVEGVQIFKFATFGGRFGPGMFYSRRIGRSVDPAVPDGGYLEERPGYASIIGAVKVSGKTTSGLSYGVLEAVTNDEHAAVVDSMGERSEVLADPLTNFTVFRLRQDFSGNSNAGMILTTVARKDRMPALTGGLDWDLKFLDNTYRLDGFLSLSRTARTGELLEGSSGKLGLAKTGGEHWRGELSGDFTSRQYNINDIGFFRRPGDYGYTGEVSYRDDRVHAWGRTVRFEVSGHQRLNIDDVLLSQTLRYSGFYRFLNYWELRLSGSFGSAAFDDRETRGLGLFRKPAGNSLRLSVESDPRSPIVFDVTYHTRSDAGGMTRHAFEVEAEIKPIPALTFEVSVEHERADKEFAWATNLTDLTVTPNEFSVFADRYTRSWDFRSRGTYVFTRDVTLQWYVQMFVAKGRFENEKRRLDVDSYTTYNGYSRDSFTDYQVHSNVVLRWEYLPGSTLFLVWSHARRGEQPLFIDPLSTNLRETFRLPPDNVLLLKVSYWLSS